MADLTAEIETLTATLDTLKKEIAAADAEIKDTKLQMTRASEDREAENAEFQQTVADQRAAQQILTLALNHEGGLRQERSPRRLRPRPGADGPWRGGPATAGRLQGVQPE